MEFRKIKSLNYLYEINEDGTCFRNMDASKYLSLKYNKSIEQIRYLLKKRRNNVFDFQVIYKE